VLGRSVGFGVVLLLGISASARAGIELVEIESAIHARHLAGIIVDPTGAPISGVLVKECASSAGGAQDSPPPEFAREFTQFDSNCENTNKLVVAWAISDSSGHFVLPKLSSNGPYQILVSSNGFDPMRMTIKLRFLAPKQLRIKMHIAT